ncbi:DNA repair protein [Thiomicrorhabdus cannonii]|uniref:DNA repair protein n=1 Tax=Thiomicrorhabdus cannonii TaxID=2748011 RepID=UPI0015B8B942|nr:DNA repair protein [Thiomicrorhabdus cannonii]
MLSFAWGPSSKISRKSEGESDSVRRQITNVWNNITGKADFLEAQERLNAISVKYESFKTEYESEMLLIAEDLAIKVESINQFKIDIYQSHFESFLSIVNRVHDVKINGVNFLDFFDESIFQRKKITGIRSDSELFKIDFNNLSLKEYFFSIFTWGFYSRKKAKETLQEVMIEEERINCEIQEMTTQLNQARVAKDSLEMIVMYFDRLLKTYEALLSKFEYGVIAQINKAHLGGDDLVDGKISFKRLPNFHLENFYVLFNLSIVLKEMSKLGYLTEQGEVIHQDLSTLEMFKEPLKNLNILVA